MELTIDIPESVVQRLRTIAEFTHQPLGELVLKSIEGNLPPDVSSAPAEVRPELLQMQTLSTDELRRIARAQVSEAHQIQHMELLSKNQDGLLTASEQTELNELTQRVDQLTLKKAHACALLRWRGQPIQSLDQLLPI